MPLDDQLRPLLGFGDQLGRIEHPRALAQPEHPREQLAAVGVLRLEDDAVLGIDELAGLVEVPLHQPLDLLRDPDPRGADRFAELPVRARRVHARVEVGRRREVVLGLRRVADLAADSGEPEDAHVVALV